MFKYQVSRNLTVTSIHGDITKVKADAVVTGEGPDLLTEGYVTQSLIKANQQLQKKRRLLRENYGELGLWTVQSTELGHPFKYVIHAVLDRGTDAKWLKNMKTLYKRIFIEAERLEISSIAVPLLGAGTGDTERSLSIQAVARSVLECTPKYLTDIMFVSNDTKVLDMFATQIMFEHSEESKGKDHFSLPAAVGSMFGRFLSIFSFPSIEHQQHSNECKSQIRGRRYDGNHKQHLKEKLDLERAIQLSKVDLKRESSSTVESAINPCTSNGDCNSSATDPATNEDSDIEVLEEDEETDTTKDGDIEAKDFEIFHNGARTVMASVMDMWTHVLYVSVI